VSVWKDARELGKAAADIAVALANGKKIGNAIKWSGGPKGVEMDAILLKPVPITRANLAIVIDAGWVEKQVVCQGVDAGMAPSACK
jgi:D-xylose transport system substrate-binding protein